MDSAAIATSVAPGLAKGKGGGDKSADDDAKAFSSSLDAARGEADGEPETTSITIQSVTRDGEQAGDEPETTNITIQTATTDSDGAGDEPETTSITIQTVTTDGDGAGDEPETTSITIQSVTAGSDSSGADGSDTDFTIEIETVVFSGDELAGNLTAATVVGDGAVTVSADGSFGVSGSISGDSEVRLEVGETLTFELPATDGEVVGGQITITNLYSNGDTAEGALVFAYDSDDNQLATYGVLGNETGTVTVDIEVPFARLDIKAMDNESWVLAQNSNLGVSSISAMIASIVEDLPDSVGQSIGDALMQSGSLLSQLVDFSQSGKVYFEANSRSFSARSTVDALSSRSWDDDQDPTDEFRYGFDNAADRERNAPSNVWRTDQGFAG